jgi:hypothetical protein
MDKIVRGDETEKAMSDMDHPAEWDLRELRDTALHAAIEINSGRGDYQEVIRAARDIFAFLRDG